MEDIFGYAPIVVFAYNRPLHTKRLLDSINSLPEAHNTVLFLFVDGAKVGQRNSVDEVINVINNFRKVSCFQKTIVNIRNENYGLAKSVICGVTEIINQFGKIIVLEDDLIVSNDFLKYMNSALSYYQNNKSIWSISGYSFPMKALQNYPHDIFIAGRACSWGWGTWTDRWNKVDWVINDYATFKFNIINRHLFAAWGKDLPYVLDAYIYKEISSWAIRWCYSAYKNHMMTIYPKHSRVLNTGTDGTGTNYSSTTSRFDTILSDETVETKFESLIVSNRIQKEFANKYTSFSNLIKLRIRWILIRIGILKAHNNHN